MKKIYLLLLLCGLSLSSFATKWQGTLKASSTLQVAAGPVCQGATNVPLESFQITMATGGTTTNTPKLSVLTFSTSGTYTSSDVTGYTLYYNTGGGAFSTGSYTSIATASASGSGSTVTFTLSSSLDLETVTTFYFYIVANGVSSSATSGHTILVNPTTAWTNMSFVSSSSPAPETNGTITAPGTLTIGTQPGSIAGTTTLCSTSGSSTLTCSPSGGVWSSSAPSVASVSTSGVVSYVANGSTSIVYTLSGGCTSSVTVTDAATSAITGTPTVCASGTTTLSCTPAGGAWSSSSPSVASVNSSTGVVTYISNGTTRITYTAASVCTSSVTVTAAANPGSISGGTTLCSGTETLTCTPGGGVWSSSSPSVASVNSSTGVVTYLTSGTTNISYTTSGVCSSSMALTDASVPAAISGSSSLCMAPGYTLTTLLTESWETGVPVSGSPVDGWNTTASSADFEQQNASASVNPNISAAESGSYFLEFESYSIASGSFYIYSPAISLANMSSATMTFWVYRDGTAYTTDGTEGFTIGVNTVSSTTGATILGFVPRSSTKATTGSYISGTSTPGSGVSNWYQYTCTVPSSYNGGNIYFLIKATSQDGDNCYLDNINVSAYGPATVTLSDAVSGDTWSSSNTSIATVSSSGIVTPITAGSATISYGTATCGYSSTSVTVNAVPAAITGTTTLCAGSTATLSDAVSGGSWTSGTTSIITVNSSTGMVAAVGGSGASVISYSNGCGTAATTTVTVTNPGTISGASTVCGAASITLSDTASSGTWSVSNGNASITSGGVLTGLAGGTDTVYYTEGACAASYTVAVSAPASVTGSSNICGSATTMLSDATAGGTWSSSSPSVATINSSGTVQGISSGSTTISYTYLGCSSLFPLTVNPATPVITGGSSICAPIMNTVSNQSFETGTTGTYSVIGTASQLTVEEYTVAADPALPAAESGNYIASFNAFSISGAGNMSLCSPSFSLASAAAGQVTFWIYRDMTAYTGSSYANEGFKIYISTTASVTATATQLGFVPRAGDDPTSGSYISGTSAPAASGWYQYTCTFPSAWLGGATNYILFKGVSQYGDNVYIDNITISTAPELSMTLSGSSPAGTWTSSNTAIATINSSTGYLSGLATGTTTVTYSNTCGSNSETFSVLGVPSLITPAYIAPIIVGGTVALSDSTSGGTWTSSNAAVASVSTTGVVTGVGTGTVTITYSTSCGSAATQTVTVAASCSGTPTAGTASVSPTSGGGTTSFVLTDAGYSGTAGIGLQWYSSTNGITYTAISGATGTPYTVPGISQNTYFVCSVTCTTSGLTAGSNTVEATYFPLACTPSFEISSCSDEYGVVATTGYPFQLTGASGAISDATACSASSYIDETSSSYTCTLNANNTYSITFGYNPFGESVTDQVWIDFNNNGTFESTESVGGSAGWTGTTETHTITLPSGTTISPGVYRMRIITALAGDDYTYPSLPACPTSSTEIFGDARDYKVTIAVPPVYTLTPTSISFAPTVPSTTSAATNAAFNAAFLVPAAGTFTVTAPTGFYVYNGTSWVSSFTISYTGSTLSPVTIPVEFAPSTTTTYSGNVTITGGGITGASVAVTGLGAAACTGVPTAGTATVSPIAGASTTVFTLSDAGYSASGGIGFQWYSSTNGITYSSISGATNSTYSFTGITQNMYYVCSVTCSYSGSTAGSSSVEATFLQTPSCTTTAASWFSESSYANGGSQFHITGYSGSTLADNALQSSINTTTGYAMRYPTIGIVNMQQNGAYPTSINWNTADADMEAQVWIDFNDDGTFQSTEVVSGSTVVGWSTSSAPNPTTFNISIPYSARPGVHLMRMRSQWDLNSSDPGYAVTNIDPCNETYPGIAEESYSGTETDYYTNIIQLPACSGTPTAGTPTATVTSGCASGYSSSMNLTGLTASGLTFQWQSSTNGTTWTSIGGATNTTYTASVTATTYYQCIETCTASSSSVNSSTVLLNATPAISGPSSSVCVSSTLALTDATSGGTWSSSSTGTATVNTAGTVTGISGGNATISYATTGCTQTYPVTVNPLPAAITGTMTACSGATSALTESVSGGTWSSNNTAIASVSTGGVVTGVSAGTTTITYTNTCGYVTAAFTVNATPNAISGTLGMCVSSTDTLSDTLTGGTWTITGAATGTSIDPTYGVITSGTVTGTETVYYTIATCSVSATVNVGNSSPAAITGTETACAGSSTTLTDATSGGSWSSSNTAVATVNATSGAVTGISAGTAVISYNSGCGTPPYSLATYTVTGSALSLSYSSAGLSGPVCSGGTLQLNSGSSTGGTYSWTGPNSFTSASQNPTISSVTTAAAGVYTFSGTYSGCSAVTGTVFVAVDAVPTVSVTQTSTTICTGGADTLSVTPTAPATTGYEVYAVPYNFVTISSPTTWSSPADNAKLNVTVPFSFSYYGTSYTSLNIVTNGWITYQTSDGTNANNYALPTTAVSKGCIAIGLLDLDPTEGGTISYGTVGSAPNREFVVYYNGVVAKGGSGSLTGEIILHETSNIIDIMVSQLNAAPTTSPAGYTLGIQNFAGTSAATVPGYNGASVTNTITTPQGWRFVYPSYNYVWAPSTDLSTTTASSTVSSGLTATQVYSVTTADANSGCTTGNISTVTVNVAGQPSVTVTPSSTALCSGSTETVTATPSGGAGSALYTYAGPGISGTAGPFASSSYTVTPASGTSSGTYTVGLTYSGVGCNSATGTSATVSLVNQQWTGAASTAWSNASNWACGSVPTATEDVVIPGSSFYTNAPALDVATGYAHALTVNSTAAVSLGANTLDVAGNLTNNGAIGGTGVVYLNGTSAQTLQGNGQVSNLTLANSAGATISSATDSVDITGTLLLNSGTLTTGGSHGTLVLVSNAGGNGSIGTISSGAGITGNVVIQQYIQGGRRAYRFMAHPFSSSIALSQIEPYIDITGSGGSANGFTSTITNSPSAYWYNTSIGNSTLGNDPGWVAFGNTSGIGSNAYNRYEGIRLFIRGAKGQGLDGTTYTPSAVTYNTYGPVNQGNQSVTMVKGTGSYQDYNLLGNPYPAVTDIGTVVKNASVAGLVTGGAFYVWNPYLGTSGQFVVEGIGSPYYLGANESFEVRTAANGNVLSFAETNKGTSPTDVLMRNGQNDNLTLYIYDNTYHPWDILNIKFSDDATDNDDAKYDGDKPPSPSSLNFYSLSADGNKLALDVRPFAANKAVPLGISSSYQQDFTIKAENVQLAAGDKLYLHDKYLQTYTMLQQGTEYDFTIGKDPASQGDNRFELRMNPDDVTQTAAKADLTVQMVPNPANDNVTITYTAASKEATSLNIINVEGVTVISNELGVQQSGSVNVDVSKLASGVYMVELKSGNDKKVSRLVKE